MDSLDQKIREAVGAWDHLGFKKTNAGSVFWGKPKPDEGIGFIHELFVPLSSSDLREIIDFNPLFKKFSYPNLLTRVNGVKAFYDAFCLYGAHKNQQSGLDLPYNLLSANIESWGILSGPDQLVIGGGNLGWRSDAYVQRSDGTVFAAGTLTTDRAGVICYEWADLYTFITSELDRLATAFDENGAETCDLEHLPHAGGKEIM